MLTLCLVTPATAGQITIAALGDSLTQGYGLRPETGFVPQLETWLQANGADVTVLNAGVSGDTTAGGKARIDWTLTGDVDALIVALGGNDVLRGIDPALSRANLEAILKTATDRSLAVLLVGITAPGNYGPDYKASFDAIYPELAAEYNIGLYPDFLHALSNFETAQVLESYMQADAIHPNAKGVALIVSDMGPSVLKLLDRVTVVK